jgi:hypothetical protein
MATRIQVVIDCADPARQASFWAEALHYVRQAPPEGFESWEAWARTQGIPAESMNDFDAILDPDGLGPRFYFQKVPEPKAAKNRMHVDLNVGGEAGTPMDERKARIWAEVARLKALGASDRRGAIEQDGEFWVRMNDPEGNEFCVQ